MGDSKVSEHVNEEIHLENGRNKFLLRCQHCSSVILDPNSAIYEKKEFDLPKVSKKGPKTIQSAEGVGGDVKSHTDGSSSGSEEVDYEKLADFYKVADMYTFENIGFTNTVGNIKYLACADCEIGPVGYYDMETKISYVAHGRVLHMTSSKESKT